MAEKLGKWASNRGLISKIRPSDGCKGDTVPRAILLFVRGSGKRRWLIWGLAISFSMWQCAGHGNAAGTGWRH